VLDIRYRRASSLAEAQDAAAKARGPLFFLAGGTDLVVRGRSGEIPAATWVDISRLPELAGIEEREEDFVLGAGTTYRALAASSLVRQHLPCLWQAIGQIGSPQIRALGTLGGNFGSASPAGDGIPPLLALDATVVLSGPGGERRVQAADFFLGPGRTVLAPGEVIVRFEVPRWRDHRSVFLKLASRRSFAVSKVSVALALELADGVIARARVALGAVAPTPLRARGTEAFLTGKRPARDVYDEAARLARSEVRPITDHRSTAPYRREMSGTLLSRAFESLCGEPPDRRRTWDVEIR
jgi:CO/xanthine dehydrogenase FAD-binding subunit